jgi:hypothetical protein
MSCNCKELLSKQLQLETERNELDRKITELKRETFTHVWVGLDKPHPGPIGSLQA